MVGSLLGIGSIIGRKLPVLVQLARVAPEKKKEEAGSAKTWTSRLVEKIPFLKDFSYLTFMQKVLSRARVLMLRLESKTGNYLQKLREQAQTKKTEAANDDYWQDLKNLIKTKDYLRRRASVKRKGGIEEESELAADEDKDAAAVMQKAAQSAGSDGKVTGRSIIEKVTAIQPNRNDRRNRRKKATVMF